MKVDKSKAIPLGEKMETKNLVGIVSLGIVILVQAAGLYSFISSKIGENTERLIEIDKKMIRIEYSLKEAENLKSETNSVSERIDDLESLTNQNFRSTLTLQRRLDRLENGTK